MIMEKADKTLWDICNEYIKKKKSRMDNRHLRKLIKACTFQLYKIHSEETICHRDIKP